MTANSRISVNQETLDHSPESLKRTIANLFFFGGGGGNFREEFSRISLCLHCACSPHSPESCLLMEQNFANSFWKGSLKEHSCEIISKSDQRFQRRSFLRISSCLCSASSPHSPEPCLWKDQTFANKFWKGSPMEQSLRNYFKIWPAVWGENIFKELPRKLHLVAMATRVFDGIEFCEQFLKEDLTRNIPAKFGPKWPRSLGGDV